IVPVEEQEVDARGRPREQAELDAAVNYGGADGEAPADVRGYRHDCFGTLRDCVRGQSAGLTTEAGAISGPANRYPRPQVQPFVAMVDRQAVALFQSVRRAVRLDLDGEKLTTRGPATALPPSAVFRFSSAITDAIGVPLGCLAARRLLSPGVLGS